MSRGGRLKFNAWVFKGTTKKKQLKKNVSTFSKSSSHFSFLTREVVLYYRKSRSIHKLLLTSFLLLFRV